jgi:choline dehydrogenase
MRSGIGDTAELKALGIHPLHLLPGVGRNLHDHSAQVLWFSGTPEMAKQMAEFEAAGNFVKENGTVARTVSSHSSGVFDGHLYPRSSRTADSWNGNPNFGPVFATRANPTDWLYSISASLQDVRSRGSIRMTTADPEAKPIIDPGYWTDPDDHDILTMLDGIEMARQFASQPPLSGLIGRELFPGSEVRDHDTLRRYVYQNSTHSWHSNGSCMMGPASDPMAVVDARGRVHGIEGLRVADASIMPKVTRAPTHFPSIVIGAKVAEMLLEDGAA